MSARISSQMMRQGLQKATSPFVQTSPNDRSPPDRTIKLTSRGSVFTISPGRRRLNMFPIWSA